MNGQMKNYKNYIESLKSTPGPWLYEDRPHIKMDLRGLVAYAHTKCVSVSELSDDEKQKFVMNASMDEVNRIREHYMPFI